MMMIGSDDRVRDKIVLYGINSKMADVSLRPRSHLLYGEDTAAVRPLN